MQKLFIKEIKLIQNAQVKIFLKWKAIDLLVVKKIAFVMKKQKKIKIIRVNN